MKPVPSMPSVQVNRRLLLSTILGSVFVSRAMSAEPAAKCWAETNPNREDRWIPCKPAMHEVRPTKIMTFDLDALTGICVTYKGRKLEISADEIWEGITSASV